MKLLIITKIKFKKYTEKIDYLLDTYAFKQINETTYIGDIEKSEVNNIKETINDIITEKDSVLLIPLTPKTAEEIIIIGKTIRLEEKKYKIL